MNVVHLIPHLRLGAGRYVVDLAVEQRRRGHAVTVAVAPDVDHEWRSAATLLAEARASGLTLIQLPDFFHRSLPALGAAAACLRTHGRQPEATVAHAHTAPSAAVAAWSGLRAIVCTCHGWNPDADPSFRIQDALAFQLCARVLSPSHHWAARLRGDSLVDTPLVVPVGLDLSRYPSISGRSAAAAPRVVCVAELSRRKGLDTLLDALPLAWTREPALTVECFGDGELRDRLAAQAEEAPWKGRVTLRGHVVDPYTRLAGFDVFCLPSRSDNLPVAVIEAMLAGLPVVATRVGGTPEMVDGAGAGWLVPPDDPPALADALVASTRAGHARRQALGAAGERYARETFDVSRTARQVESIYAEALARTRSQSSCAPV